MSSHSHVRGLWTGAPRRAGRNRGRTAGRTTGKGQAGRRALGPAGRAGFAARGVIYVLVGILALRIAFGHRGEADRQGALQQIATRPFGTVLLWLLAAGFAGMALWRAAQVFPRAFGGRGGSRKKGTRAMNAVRAAFYAAVCWGTAAYAAGSGGSGNSNTQSRDWTASALKLPAGRLLVGAAGCALIAAGAAVAVRAWQRRFLRKLDTGRMSRRERRVVTFCGTAGGIARGAVFAGAGVFVLTAAVRYDPGRAKGMDATLRSFAGTSAGPWLLVAVAAGLVLFGLFSFASARWRRV
ncbi:DUF1206 domain-containing protein [Actinacidiphila acididurans]|uniref:DUF1206 domain-containing protein n=1 Tax=Actinacidiphila acididurans TaxID=2784346 RepID=A0ABS2TMZ7_9ACTN|nr:DUF1206 domain-containing protein [Actinacidiphila acididurans]MBM9504723.1 DUF1206 domain-containing protein [Actinacidiphila acididurans]